MILDAHAFLFDLDGTLIDSLPAVDRAWTTWCALHGLDPAVVLPRIHGRRSFDSIRELLPDHDALAEDARIRALEVADTTGVVALPGALELLARLPAGSWAVVTSGTSDVAGTRMRAVGIEPPPESVYGEDVERGKPDPAPFRLGAERLGRRPEQCVAFEDTVAGAHSARDAGCRVVAIGDTAASEADFWVQSLAEVEIEPTEGGWRIGRRSAG